MAGIYNSNSGQVGWQLANLPGDLVAAIDGSDEGLSRASEASKYGTPLGRAWVALPAWMGLSE